MQQKSWRKWELIGLFFVVGAGNLLHFVYEWCGKSRLAALFSGVNESTWEHMKLLAVPWLIWTAAEGFALRGRGVLAARAAGLITGLVFIPTVYYTYTGALGVSSSLVNILIFQAAVLSGAAVTWHMLKERKFSAAVWRAPAAVLLLALAALFVWWTFAPPVLPLFTDPVSGLRGAQ